MVPVSEKVWPQDTLTRWERHLRPRAIEVRSAVNDAGYDGTKDTLKLEPWPGYWIARCDLPWVEDQIAYFERVRPCIEAAGFTCEVSQQESWREPEMVIYFDVCPQDQGAF